MDINLKVFQDVLTDLPRCLQVSARTLFDMLDPKLDPQIGAVAIPFNKNELISLKSTAGFNSQADWFGEIRSFLEEIPEWSLKDLAPDVQGVLWEQKVKIVDATRKIVDEKSSDTEHRAFPTLPEFMHGHCVFLILQISNDALESHYRLTKNAARPYPSQTSLIYETIVHFLSESLTPLKILSEGRAAPIHFRDHGNNAMREAGYWLMYTVGKATGNGASDDLFRAFNVISSLQYEGDEGIGRIVICRQNHPNVDTVVRLRNRIALSNYRAIRKMLEMASNDICLLCDVKGIFGLGRVNAAAYNRKSESLFVVEFSHGQQWELEHADSILMLVKYGVPGLPAKPINEDKFRLELMSKYPQLDTTMADCLWDLVVEASKQKSGTTLVISDHANDEAERLKNQSTLIDPTLLTKELILPLSSIDGALLMDPEATCYSVGVILDGMATKKGDPGRGARYNSAIRYLEYATKEKHSCLIVVISEDGAINLF